MAAVRRSRHCGALRSMPFPLLVCVVWALMVSSADAFSNRGMSPQDKAKYAGQDTFICKQSGRVLSIEKLNDDFCDCPDGTDEPGTSACALGTFYCANRGHVPLILHSSRVNDGICDCCDGTDEYNGWVKCEKTCIAAGAEARKELAAKVEKYKEGARIREAAVSGAALQRQQWQEKADALKAQTAALEESENKLREEKEAIEKAEREEREWREKLEKEQQERERVEQEGRQKPEQAQGEEQTQGEEQSQREEKSEGEEQAADGEHGVEGDGIMQGDAEEGEATEEEVHSEEDAFPPPGEEVDFDQANMDEEARVAAELAAAGYTSPHDDGGAPPTPDQTHPPEDDQEEDLSHLSNEERGRRIAERWTGGGGGGGGGNGGHGESEQQEAPAVGEDGEDLSHLSKEEIGRRVAERWTGGGHQHSDSETETAHSDDDDDHEEHMDDHEDFEDFSDHDNYDAHHDEDTSAEEESSNPDTAVSPRATWWARMLQWPKSMCSRIYSLVSGPPSPPDVNHTEAVRIRKEYSEVSKKLADVRSELSSLEDKLKSDHGPLGEFIDFVDKCFNFNVQNYVYEVCPYKEVTQKEGHMQTTVGRWKGFDENYSRMVFENGDHCWNGPSRSMKVSMECGMATEILSVEEPSRCEYHAVMLTPALCSADKAKEFQEELEKREQEIASIHDEL